MRTMTTNTRTPEELLEEIRRTAVAVCIIEDRYDVVVAPSEAVYEDVDLPPIEVRLPIPEEYRTTKIANSLWTDQLEYPQGAEPDQSYVHLVGAEALNAAIRQVGDTVIAHLIGMDAYLSAARAVLVSNHDADFSIQTFTLTADPATGMVAPDTSRALSALILQALPGEKRVAGVEMFTWPSTAAPHILPDFSGDPVLSLALRLMGGGE